MIETEIPRPVGCMMIVPQPAYDSEYLGDTDTTFFANPLGTRFSHKYTGTKNYADTNLQQGGMLSCESFSLLGISLSHGVIPKKFKSDNPADYINGWPLELIERGSFEFWINGKLNIPLVPIIAMIKSLDEISERFIRKVNTVLLPSILKVSSEERIKILQETYSNIKNDHGFFHEFYKMNVGRHHFKIGKNEYVKAMIRFSQSKNFDNSDRMLVHCFLHGFSLIYGEAR